MELTPELTRQIYDDAIAHIEKYGWTQVDVGAEGKPCCVIGAMRVAAYKHLYYKPLAAILIPFGKVADVSIASIGAWNDRKGRTKEEVLEKLKAAREMV
jgi:hypothetical protein